MDNGHDGGSFSPDADNENGKENNGSMKEPFMGKCICQSDGAANFFMAD